MGKIMKDGIQYGVGGIQKAEGITYDNTDSGMTATNVQGALDELNNDLSNLIIKEDTVMTTSFSAGTIGTRGAQYSWDNPHEHDDYKIIAMLFLYIGNSNEYNAQAFYSNGKIYCNFYRAHTGASAVNATLRVVYAKI
jgi:hypothetical protein